MLYIDSATCACVSDDSSLMSVGFNESQLRVFSLTPEKLRSMKPADDLNVIDKEAGASGMSPSVDTLSMHKERIIWSCVMWKFSTYRQIVSVLG